MRKRYFIILLVLGLLIVLGFTGFAIWQAKDSALSFAQAGYILRTKDASPQLLSFRQGETYDVTISGAVQFQTTGGQKVTIPRESFAHFEDSGTTALSDGVLLDFNDLSDNFINNYYIPAGLVIREGGAGYTAETTAGTMEFGEHVWKLTDSMYILRSPSLRVHFGKGESHEAGNFVQISFSNDGVCYIQSSDNVWNTISPDCYIQTQSGVKVYPVSLLVDSGTYKLSMAKLAVSTDDAIVLTEDETRRQIVPQFEIHTIDGEDGEDGGKGEAGNEGAEGNKGNGGVQGSTGTPGGSLGQGNLGTPGDNAGDTSVKSALPYMTIKDWQVTGDSLRGTFYIWDEAYMLQLKNATNPQVNYPATVTITDVVTGEVIQTYNLGKAITNDIDINETDFSEAIRQGSHKASIHFAVQDGALQPGREYNLRVNAYYMPEESNLIFSRDFIDRNFVTDTVGLSLAYEMATTDSIKVSAIVSGSKNANDRVQLFLMTQEQALAFDTNINNISDATKYLMKSDFFSMDGTPIEYTFVSDGTVTLNPNTAYVVRAYVEKEDGDGALLNVIADQVLDVKTLKRPPEILGNPIVNYTRTAGGAFQVSRQVNDLDKGAVKYTYTVYKASDPTTPLDNPPPQEIYPSAAEPIEFRNLESDVEYIFGITMEFFDNEKTIIYDLGKSDPIKCVGGSLPTLSLSVTKTEYNIYKGLLTINMASNTYLPADTDISSYPLTVEILSDQGVRFEVTFSSFNNAVNINGNNATNGTAKLMKSSTDKWVVDLDMKNLLEGTNYTVTTYGYVDLDRKADGTLVNGLQRYNLGTRDFRTYDMVSTIGEWDVAKTEELGANEDFKLNLKVKLKAANATTGVKDTRGEYAESQFAGTGATTIIHLYRGETAVGTPVGIVEITDPTQLANLFYYEGEENPSPGLDLTNNSFGYESGKLEASTYCCAIMSFSDGVNVIDENIDFATKTITSNPAPPQLAETLKNPITVTPILNANASSYGATRDLTIPDDAIIGYVLAANYSNTQRLAKTVTYYAFEMREFYQAQYQNADPIEIELGRNATNADGSPKEKISLMKVELPVSSSKDKVPRLVVLFGGTKSTALDLSLGNDTYRYWTGEAVFDANSKSLEGMGRGYRYLFAYTVGYNPDVTGTSVTHQYPYDLDDYLQFCNSTSGGFVIPDGEDKVRVVAPQQPRCFLISDVVDAPMVYPTFYSYVQSTEVSAGQSPSAATFNAKVHLNYTWEDPDGMIVKRGLETEDSRLYIQQVGSTTFQDLERIGQNDLTGASGWYTTAVPYTLTGNATEGNVSLAVGNLGTLSGFTGYVPDYNKDVFNAVQDLAHRDDERYVFATIPVERDYTNAYNTASNLTLSVQYVSDRNYLEFKLNNASDLLPRAVGLRVEVSKKKTATTSATVIDTYDLVFVTESGQTFAKLPTSNLLDYLNQELTISKAQVWFDSGLQGWNYAINPSGNAGNNFTVQSIGSRTGTGVYDMGLGGYPYAELTSDNTLKANGAWWISSNYDGTQHHTALTDKAAWFMETTSDAKSYYRNYLYPQSMGISTSVGTGLNGLNHNYVVPKKLASKSVTPPTGEADFTITGATPTVGFGSPTGSETKLSIPTEIITVKGMTANQQLQVELHTSYESAKNKSEAMRSGIYTVGANGSLTPETGSFVGTTLEFTGLTPNTTYYVAFYTVINQQKTLLLDERDMDLGIFDVTTPSENDVEITDYRFYNDSYYNKRVEMDFLLNYVANQEITYNIYSDAACTEASLVMSHGDLTADGGILKITGGTSRTRTAILYLNPLERREDLVPGRTYYLRIHVKEKGGTSAGQYDTQAIELPPTNDSYAGNIRVTANDRVENTAVPGTYKNSLGFKVTMIDEQKSLMGAVNTTTAQGTGGLYAVRFFKDVGGKMMLLRTTYDDKVYAFNQDVKKDFVLSADTIVDQSWTYDTMDDNTEYTMRVYAVADPKHVGSAGLLEGTYTVSPGKYFNQGSSTDPGTWGEAFLTEINSFWNTDGSFVAAKQDLEEDLTIGECSVYTLGSGGYHFEEESITVVRREDNTVRVEIMDSYNLTAANGMSIFDKIEVEVRGDTVKYSETLTDAPDKPMLHIGKNFDGYDVYYFNLRDNLPRGVYTIILHFWLSDDDIPWSNKLTV